MNVILKNILRFIYYLPSNCINFLQYKVKHVEVGKKHETKGVLFLKVASSARIIIGDNVRINSKGSANPIGGGERTYFQVLKHAELRIGNHTRISNCAITAVEGVTIGNYVRIGAGVRIFDTDFHSLNPVERTSEPEKGKARTASITICDYAFLGTGALILKGVIIG